MQGTLAVGEGTRLRRDTYCWLSLGARDQLSQQMLHDLKSIPLLDGGVLIVHREALLWEGCWGLDYQSRKSSSPGPPEKCQSSEFQCRSHACLNVSLVCDGKEDCADGSDEGGKCSSSACGQAQCSHSCYKSPQGPVSWFSFCSLAAMNLL